MFQQFFNLCCFPFTNQGGKPQKETTIKIKKTTTRNNFGSDGKSHKLEDLSPSSVSARFAVDLSTLQQETATLLELQSLSLSLLFYAILLYLWLDHFVN